MSAPTPQSNQAQKASALVSQIEQKSAVKGKEVAGLNVSKPLTDEDVKELDEAFGRARI